MPIRPVVPFSRILNDIVPADRLIRFFDGGHRDKRVLEIEWSGSKSMKESGKPMEEMMAYCIVRLRKELLRVWRYPVRCVGIILLERRSRGGNG